MSHPIDWTTQGQRLSLLAYAVAIIRPFFGDHPPSTNSIPSWSSSKPASAAALSYFGQSWSATNLASGIKKVKERRDHRMPERDVFRRVQDYARRCSERGAKGALPAYVWVAMEFNYQARVRGIEVRTLTDHHVEGEVSDQPPQRQSRQPGAQG